MVDAATPAAFTHRSVIAVSAVRDGVLVDPSVEPSISSTPEPVVIEQRSAFELPQMRMAEEPMATGFGSTLSETVGAGGVTTGIEHVTVGLTREPLTHCRRNRIVVEPVRDVCMVARPVAAPPVANPVELAEPVRHDHAIVTRVDVPYGTDEGEHESDGASGGITTGSGSGALGN